jgi:hypothetical protein
MREIVKDPVLLAEKRKALDTLRADDNKEWAQNREFYKGNQWVMWNNVSNSIETLGVAETDRPRYKVRLVNNIYQTNTNQLVAQMTKTRPVIHAVPGSGADTDVKAAQFAERLYEVKWEDLSLRSKLQSALVNAQISQGYWLITWDGLAGKAMKVMLDPQGQPIWDQELAGIFKEELRDAAKQAGQDPQDIIAQFEKVVYLGDVKIDVLDGPSVWLDPVPNNWEDCSYVIVKIPMTVDDIEARYGKKVTPNASSGDRSPALMYSTKNESNNRPANVRETFHIYHKPTPAMPQGRYACWIESPDMFLLESGWELPISTLPLVKFSGIERPGSVYDECRGTGARPMQKELNDIISGIAMHRRITMKPQMIAPVGSMRQRLTDEPGAVFEYNPVAGMTPEWRQTPPLPAYVFETLQDVQRRLDRHFNIMPTERSSLPARTDSGHMVELVMEAVADQLSPEIQRMEISLAKTGDIIAAYAQKWYQEERMLRIKGPGGSVSVKKFMNTDLDGSYSFAAEAGTGLPRTREGQVQQIKEMVEMGVLDPHEAIQYLPIAGLKGVQSRIASDEDFASRKIDKLIKGEPLNPAAMQQAIQMVQQTGQNPDTGEFFTSPEEAMAFVQSAALKPYLFENLQLGMQVIAEAMKTPEFEKYGPDIQQRFEDHFSQLRQTMFSIPQIDPNGVRVTLGLNGTVGPTAAAEILRKKGLYDITPDVMMEEPLETSVYDSMDKPDADTAGNDPLSEFEQMTMVQAQQSANQLKDAKATQALAHAQHSAEQGASTSAADARRAEELHQQKMAHAEAMHQKKLKEPSSAPAK